MSLDAIYASAKELVIGEQRCSVVYLQRRFAISYTTAVVFVEQMVQEGIVAQRRSHTLEYEVLQKPTGGDA